MGFVGDVIGGVAGGLFGDEGGQTSESVQGLSELARLFPQTQEVGDDIFARGQDLATQTAPFFTPLLPEQEQIARELQNLDLGYRPQFDFGKRASQTFGQANNLFGTVAPTLNLAGQRISQGVDPITGQEIQAGIDTFMNPYEDLVVQNAARDARESGLGLLSDIGQRASQSGAFGSTRQGVVESIVPEQVSQQVGDLSARLRQSGFNTAAGNAMNLLQGNRYRSLQGAGLGIEQAGAAISGGKELGALGSRMMDARRTVADLQTQSLQNQLARQQGRLSGSDMLRGATQAQNQVPLQQLSLLQNIIAGFPTSGTTSRTIQPQTQGLLSGGGNIAQGLGNLVGGISSLGQQPPYVTEAAQNSFSSGLDSIGNFFGGFF